MRLVIGIGNTLRGDDGIGVAVAEHIAARHSAPDLQVIACHQLTPELIPLISQAEQVIFIDASVSQPAGSVQVLPLAVEDACVPSVHHTTPAALLAAAKTLYGAQPRGMLVAVGAQDFGYSEQLSARVAQALPRAAQLILSLLEEQLSEAP
ncbi:MAG: hydrogenase maturation protease [Aggregatilineales bacterium]